MKSREQTEASDDYAQKRAHLNRREFCNTLAVTSAALAVVATGMTSQAEAGPQEQHALVYPPRKIDGAERLLPGSSMYFTYPTSSDPAILVRARDGQFYAYSQKCERSWREPCATPRESETPPRCVTSSGGTG